ncbi:hypothetical protein EMPS_06155 [Entomortierella parvispora]|uniref:Uncharacterized protein n=1 Tax=Entomortierella parvispora TaxID=205924 RepID=A0A9P3HBX3_9FUNG|nr:hypothetical protein EMPS_06155 [Entomortierella parvispora]
MPSSPTHLDPSRTPVATSQPSYGSVSANPQGPAVILGAGVGSTVGELSTTNRSVHIVVPSRSGLSDNDNNDAISISTKSSYSTYSSLQDLDAASGKRSCDDNSDNDDDSDINASARRLFWIYVALAPILLSILVLFAGLLQLLPANDQEGYLIHWDSFGVGALGWMFTFGSRTPIFALLSNILELNSYCCEWYTLVLGAAVEEITRWILLSALNIRSDFGAVYWLGLGWAGMETIYYIGQSLVYSHWLSDDDYRAVTTATSIGVMDAIHQQQDDEGEEDEERRLESITRKDPENELLLPTTTTTTTTSTAAVSLDSDAGEEDVSTREVRHLLGIDRPWWSLMGRTSSMMVHLGLCGWLGYGGWKLLVPAAMIHAAIYVLWGVFMPGKWSVPAASYGTLMTAMAIFLIGLALYGQIV